LWRRRAAGASAGQEVTALSAVHAASTTQLAHDQGLLVQEFLERDGPGSLAQGRLGPRQQADQLADRQREELVTGVPVVCCCR